MSGQGESLRVIRQDVTEMYSKDWPFHKTLCRSGLTGELITLKSAGEKVKDAFLPANLWGKDVHAWVMEHRKNLLPLGYLTLGCPDPVEYNARGAAERQVVVIGIERQPDEPLSRRFRIRFHETQREPEAERIYSAGFAKTRLPLQDETADKEDYIVISMVFAQITAKDEMTYFDYAAAWEAGGGLMDLIKRTEDTPDWIWDAVKALIHGESPPSDPPGLKQKIPDDEWIPEELSGNRFGFAVWQMSDGFQQV